MMYEITHTPELIEAIEEYNAGIHPTATGLRLNIDEFQEYETASEAVKDLAGLEMEEKAARGYLLESTMILEVNGKTIARAYY